MKFLIDECLSLELALRARERGYGQSSHVVWRGLSGVKDWDLMPFILDGDWIFVTNNSFDFRGPPSRPGSKGQYAGIEIHAGLICPNCSSGMDMDLQIELFDQALEELSRDGDLVNQVLEITLEGDNLRVQRYAMPA